MRKREGPLWPGNGICPSQEQYEDIYYRTDALWSETVLIDGVDPSTDSASCLFNWHRSYDGGLWLEIMPNQTPEATRHLQRHPWIHDPWQNDDHNSADEDDKSRKVDRNRIEQ